MSNDLDFGDAGSRLLEDLANQYEIDARERAIIEQCSRTLDHLAELDAEVARDGVTVESPHGAKAHPALVEARAQRVLLARLFATLGVEHEGTARGARGVYEPKAVA